MSELDRILVTSATTILGGVAVLTVGQLISKFFIEPIYEQRKLIGVIADSLIYYAHYFADSFERPFSDVRDASDKFRRLASELMARSIAMPGYRLWGALRVTPPFKKIIAARGGLIGLSNSLHRADWQLKLRFASEIATALGVTAIDVGLLAGAENGDT